MNPTAQTITEAQTTRIYRDMMYKAARGEKFPVLVANKSFGASTWISKASDVRLNKHSAVEVFNGYTWQQISITTLRIWLRRARQQRTQRTVAIAA